MNNISIPYLIICVLFSLILDTNAVFAQNQNKMVVVPLAGNNLGYEKVEQSKFYPIVPPDGSASATAYCPAGKVVTGGGCHTLFAPEFVVELSSATNSTKKWVCTLRNITNGNANVTVIVQAICINPN